MNAARWKFRLGSRRRGDERGRAGVRARPLPREIRRATRLKPWPCRRSRTSTCRAPRDAAGFARRASARRSATIAPPILTASPTPTMSARMLGQYDCAPDVVAYPRNEAEISAVMDWAGKRRRVSDAVRRRLERLRRRRASPGRTRTSGRHHRSAPSRQGAGGRPDLARGADRGRRVRARRSKPAEAARTDAAPLSAELRIFDARRLDRDAIRRPFRQPLYPYRRSRRKPARRHAERRDRDAAPARIGRGAEPGPHVHRLRRHSRGHLAGLDAAAGEADAFAPAAASDSQGSSPPRGPSARSRRPASIPRTAAFSTRGRPTTPAPATAPPRSWCWLSSPATIRSTPG